VAVIGPGYSGYRVLCLFCCLYIDGRLFSDPSQLRHSSFALFPTSASSFSGHSSSSSTAASATSRGPCAEVVEQPFQRSSTARRRRRRRHTRCRRRRRPSFSLILFLCVSLLWPFLHLHLEQVVTQHRIPIAITLFPSTIIYTVHIQCESANALLT
jgi:hypothetical protein